MTVRLAAVRAWRALRLGPRAVLHGRVRGWIVAVGGGWVVLFWLVLALSSLQTARYLEVWQSNLTLWHHAARRAPLKPRPWLNLANALINRHRDAEAAQVLDYAERLLNQPQVPAWDRRDARIALHQGRGDLVRRPPK